MHKCICKELSAKECKAINKKACKDVEIIKQWREEGRCPACGELGRFIGCKPVCSTHGPYDLKPKDTGSCTCTFDGGDMSDEDE